MTSDDIKQIETVMDKRLTAAEKRLKEDIGNFMQETLLPLINERFDAVDERFDAVDERFDAVDERLDAVDERLDGKADKTDIDRIERKLDRLIDTSLDHKGRIKDIESIPVIAHELKRTKTR